MNKNRIKKAERIQIRNTETRTIHNINKIFIRQGIQLASADHVQHGMMGCYLELSSTDQSNTQ